MRDSVDGALCLTSSTNRIKKRATALLVLCRLSDQVLEYRRHEKEEDNMKYSTCPKTCY